jgi:hypothetical protein
LAVGSFAALKIPASRPAVFLSSNTMHGGAGAELVRELVLKFARTPAQVVLAGQIGFASLTCVS